MHSIPIGLLGVAVGSVTVAVGSVTVAVGSVTVAVGSVTVAVGSVTVAVGFVTVVGLIIVFETTSTMHVNSVAAGGMYLPVVVVCSNSTTISIGDEITVPSVASSAATIKVPCASACIILPKECCVPGGLRGIDVCESNN